MEAWKVLGVAEGSSPEAVREAYLAAVKRHPPERDPAAFEAVRDAYELLRDPRRRAKIWLLGDDPGAPLVSLLEGQPAPRRFVGPEPWLAVLKRRRR